MQLFYYASKTKLALSSKPQSARKRLEPTGTTKGLVTSKPEPLVTKWRTSSQKSKRKKRKKNNSVW